MAPACRGDGLTLNARSKCTGLTRHPCSTARTSTTNIVQKSSLINSLWRNQPLDHVDDQLPDIGLVVDVDGQDDGKGEATAESVCSECVRQVSFNANVHVIGMDRP